MLEDNYHEQLNQLLLATESRITIPPEMYDFFAQKGVIEPIVDDHRRFVRRHFRAKYILELQQTLRLIPREPQHYCIYIKNLSRCGISFLHSEQLYPGEQPMLWLSTGKMSVTVARCNRHNETCYEIGATFVDGT